MKKGECRTATAYREGVEPGRCGIRAHRTHQVYQQLNLLTQVFAILSLPWTPDRICTPITRGFQVRSFASARIRDVIRRGPFPHSCRWFCCPFVSLASRDTSKHSIPTRSSVVAFGARRLSQRPQDP